MKTTAPPLGIHITIGDSTITGTVTDGIADVTATGAFLRILASDDVKRNDRLRDALATLTEVVKR